MKRIIAIIMIVSVTICVGCGTKRPAVDIEGQLLEADRLFSEGSYEEVISTLEAVLELEPATVKGYLRLSDAYIAKGEEDKALELLQRGLDLTGDEEIAARIQDMTEEFIRVVDVSNNKNTTLILAENGDLYYCGITPRWDVEESLAVPKKIDGASNIKELMVHPYGCYYITNDNELYGWGDCVPPLDFNYNAYGSDYSIPRKIANNVKKISCDGEGGFESGGGLLLLTNGALYSWGDNANGELGRGYPFNETWDDNTWVSRWHKGIVMYNVADINYAINGDLAQACAVTFDGRLYVWGGIEEIEQDGEKVIVRYNVPQMIANKMVEAAIYDQGILGIDKDNNLVKVCWESPGLSNVKVTTILEDVKEFECTTDYYVALGMDGTVYTGSSSNDARQMEGGPKPIGGVKAAAISIGGKAHTVSTFAITEKGKLLAWGNNKDGQLGIGNDIQGEEIFEVKLPQ